MRCSARRPNPPEAPRLELKDALFDAEAEPTRIRPKAKHQISFFLPSCLASKRFAQAASRRGGVGRWDPRRGTSDPTHPTLQSRIRRRSEESTAGGPAPHPPRRSTDLGFSLATHSTSGVRGQSPRCATDFGKEIGIKKALFGAEAEPTGPRPIPKSGARTLPKLPPNSPAPGQHHLVEQFTRPRLWPGNRCSAAHGMAPMMNGAPQLGMNHAPHQPDFNALRVRAPRPRLQDHHGSPAKGRAAFQGAPSGRGVTRRARLSS